MLLFIYMNSKHKCPECGLVFESHSKKANHIKWHHRNIESTIEKIRAVRSNQRGYLIMESRNCLKCEKPFEIRYYSNSKRLPANKYCSRTCANSRVQTDCIKSKKSNAVKKKWQEGIYDKIQRSKVETNKIFSSKNERFIRDWIKKVYPEDDWKSGGGIVVEGSRISRDLYSDKLKICFEYDGVWHFKDIHNQLRHKQEIDRKLERWCVANNYRLIRVDEEVYEGINQIISLIYERVDMIIKLGKRY